MNTSAMSRGPSFTWNCALGLNSVGTSWPSTSAELTVVLSTELTLVQSSSSSSRASQVARRSMGVSKSGCTSTKVRSCSANYSRLTCSSPLRAARSSMPRSVKYTLCILPYLSGSSHVYPVAGGSVCHLRPGSVPGLAVGPACEASTRGCASGERRDCPAARRDCCQGTHQSSLTCNGFNITDWASVVSFAEAAGTFVLAAATFHAGGFLQSFGPDWRTPPADRAVVQGGPAVVELVDGVVHLATLVRMLESASS